MTRSLQEIKRSRFVAGRWLMAARGHQQGGCTEREERQKNK
jgi:hypothetical protein